MEICLNFSILEYGRNVVLCYDIGYSVILLCGGLQNPFSSWNIKKQIFNINCCSLICCTCCWLSSWLTITIRCLKIMIAMFILMYIVKISREFNYIAPVTSLLLITLYPHFWSLVFVRIDNLATWLIDAKASPRKP